MYLHVFQSVVPNLTHKLILELHTVIQAQIPISLTVSVHIFGTQELYNVHVRDKVQVHVIIGVFIHSIFEFIFIEYSFQILARITD